MQHQQLHQQLQDIQELAANTPPSWTSKEGIERTRNIRSAWAALQLKLFEEISKATDKSIGRWS